jgi:ABC-type sugar transport system ATPase subunit
MGASGAGKSTFISLITGKAKRTSGTVTVNGEVVNTLQDHPSCRGRIGFVPQEDVMLRDLSPSEIIAFSARFRLPASLTSAEVQRRINECIDVLELEKVKDDVVGDERTRGISGGQRKRVNVGIELVADPKVLFLDEVCSLYHRRPQGLFFTFSLTQFNSLSLSITHTHTRIHKANIWARQHQVEASVQDSAGRDAQQEYDSGCCHSPA